jgi:putative tryptophan/tyrosine transport system substrate-binding protein
MRRRAFILALGGAAAWPLAARAQQPPRIAIVHPSVSVTEIVEASSWQNFRVLFEELRRLGHVEGKTIIVDRYSGGGRGEQFAALAADVVSGKPDVIFAFSARIVRSLRTATATIPIVAVTSDPVAFGFAQSLARPAGNITGVSADAGIEIIGKRLELLREAIPTLSRVGFLASQQTWLSPEAKAMRDAALHANMSLANPMLEGSFRPEDYQRVFAAMSEQKAQALIVSSQPENLTYCEIVVDLAEKARLPAIYPWREPVDIGGLMAYAYDGPQIMRHAAGQIDQILKGANPGNIPFFQPTKFALLINSKAARAIDLSLPPTLLARADEVIE